jgi:tricorn protease
MRPKINAAMKFKLLLVCLCTGILSSQAQQKGYYRTPAIFQNTVLFTAEGDLWKYDINTGSSARLTTHAGLETNPIFSPDGNFIVFSAEYEGFNELYQMPTNGGIPKRLTYNFDGGDTRANGFTPAGQLLYRSGRFSQLPSPQLATLNLKTNTAEPVPLWQASLGCYDANGTLFFTRFPNQGSKTKRYKGGNIEQIWQFNGKTEATNLTGDFDGTSTSPMLYQNQVFFLCDRDGTMNIWSMNKTGKDLQQQTFSKGWDIQSPAIFENTIVYQKGADLWLFNINTKKETQLNILLQSDFDQRKPKWINSASTTITNADISPNGKYASIVSRGRLFVTPAKSDRWIEISRKSGIRIKSAQFINDKSMAVLSDESGEFEIWKMAADGSDTAKQITHNSTTLITSFSISPNEKLLAFNNKNDELRIIDINSGTVVFKYDSAYSGLADLGWSPDSRYLHISRGLQNLATQICVIDLLTKQLLPVTTPRLDSYSPAFTSDSSWLYFISDRNLHTKISSPWGSRQPEPVYTETAGIYAIRLDSSAKFPFLSTDSWLSDTLFSAMPYHRFFNCPSKPATSLHSLSPTVLFTGSITVTSTTKTAQNFLHLKLKKTKLMSPLKLRLMLTVIPCRPTIKSC